MVSTKNAPFYLAFPHKISYNKQGIIFLFGKERADLLCTDRGVLAPSDYYFATPSLTAKNLFYHLLSVGEFFCEQGYYVKRDSFNSLLLLYLLDGECTLRYGGKVYRAQKGDMMFVNCYQPHEYFTDTHMHCLWVHFDGCQSLGFWETVTKSRGMVDCCHHPEPYLEMMDILLHIFRTDQTLSEPTISVLLHKVLCSMIAAITADGTLQLDEGPVARAARYILEHYNRRISVEELAQMAMLSSSHFSRQFKRQTGYSPYEFLLKTRMDAAKQLLKKTDLPIASIARETGFANAPAFVSAFHSRVGISPKRFRSTMF